MSKEQVETAIIGGGQAGLAMSYCLSQLRQEHIVLERHRVAQRWRERWDSLTFQGPNWNTSLPGLALQATDPNAFASRDEIVRFIEDYAAFIRAPMCCGVEARALRQKSGSTGLLIETSAGLVEAKNVVIATGPFQVPLASLRIGGTALQLHSSRYRNPQLLPPGAVLVIGSANSGTQIAEELCAAGRRVYLSVSKHRRTPRRYRGKDYVWWVNALGEADATVDSRQPPRLVTGVGGGHEVDLGRLAADGVVLLGRVVGGQDGRLAIAPDLGENLARADASLIEFTQEADDHAIREGLDLPPSDGPYSEILPDPEQVADPILTLDLAAADISTVIWANGFRYDFSWIELPIFANDPEPSNRVPVHQRGVTRVPGIYFLGLPWLHKYKSSLMYGVGEDAEHLAKYIAADVRR
jgi:putative flavoprotein involved in K+ transport